MSSSSLLPFVFVINMIDQSHNMTQYLFILLQRNILLLDKQDTGDMMGVFLPPGISCWVSVKCQSPQV